jgi:signal transduction histidine kinase
LISMSTEIRQAVDHAERLIEALLVLARNDQPRALTEPLDLATITEDALDGRVSTDLAVTAILDEAPVTGDATLLERLVTNLLDNAERYNVTGGTITISTSTDAAAAVLRVVNTGPVIPADTVKRLFLPFTRLDDRTRHDGFGLGLTLVSSIATVHDGAVEAAAPQTGGLDIAVSLPRRDKATTAQPPANRGPEARSSMGASRVGAGSLSGVAADQLDGGVERGLKGGGGAAGLGEEQSALECGE